jgi:hypothetical protein
MNVLTNPFPRQASSASLFAPLLASAVGVQLWCGTRTSPVIIGLVSTMLFGTGFILGMIAVVQTWHFRETGVFAKGIMGAIFNGLLIAGMAAFFPWAASGHPGAARPTGGSAARATAGWHWSYSAANQPNVAIYDQDGIQFSYDKRWMVIEKPEATNAATGLNKRRLIAVTDEDKAYGVFIVSIPFDPARANPSLEMCARSIVFETFGLRNPPVENITGDLGGARLPAVRIHFKYEKPDGSPVMCDSDFLLLENPRQRVVVGSVWPVDTDRAPVDAVLTSLKINGMNNVAVSKRGDPSKPHVQSILYTSARATAVIDNKTVSAGDQIDGCSVVAIGKDWVSVLSPGGVRKVLQIGDNLK